MRLIILDLEMNQPSGKCIQVGAVYVDLKKQAVLSRFDQYCYPGEDISEEITELTGITDEMVKGRLSVITFRKFWEWVDKCKCGGRIAAWGSDLYEIKRQSEEIKIKNVPEKLTNLNLIFMSMFFRSAMGKGKQRGGLKNTMDFFNLEFEGKQHNALWDAYNTAKLCFCFYDIIEKQFRIDKIMKSC